MKEKTYKQSGKTLTSKTQKEVYSLVSSRGSYGMTDAEVQGSLGVGHGSSSSALSTLHKNGYLARLKEKRGRFTVYVAPQYIHNRDVLPPMTNKGLVAVGHSNESDRFLETKVAYQDRILDELREMTKKKWRSPSYSREDLLHDLRKVLK